MKVCALIVTYNRKELLKRCVERCLQQTVKPDIFIFDNHSTDSTKNFLEQEGVLPNQRITYYYSEVNIGGSGGFSTGMEMVHKCGYDFIFLMDDDGYPAIDECFEICLNVYQKVSLKNKCIVNAAVTIQDSSNLSFRTGGFSCLEDMSKEAVDGVYYDSISPFNGTLISKEVIEEIGYPRKDFFIKGDETEYSCRAEKNKIRLVTAVNAIYVHPSIPVQKKHFLFYTFDYGEESFWKEYYHTRNYVYIYKTYFGYYQLFKHIFFTLIKFGMCKEDKKRKRKYLLKGLKDGFMNNFTNISF